MSSEGVCVCVMDSKCVSDKRGVLDLIRGFEMYTQPEVCGLEGITPTSAAD